MPVANTQQSGVLPIFLPGLVLFDFNFESTSLPEEGLATWCHQIGREREGRPQRKGRA